MPNLDSWIEAQLKRGYSRKQIKSALIRKGYSPKAVAEVDKARVFQSTKVKVPKKFPSKSVIWAILLVVTVFAVWFLAAPFFSKQPAGNIIPEQKSDEQAKQDEANPPLSGEELRRLKEIEASKSKERGNEFNNDFCNSLIPENIRSMQVSEYTLNYHIDSSQGENVRWVASEQPLAEFSFITTPNLFFVYSGNVFEGCGYVEETVNKEFAKDMKDKMGLPISCTDKEAYINLVSYELYDGVYISSIESGEKITKSAIFTVSGLIDREEILSDLGCEK